MPTSTEIRRVMGGKLIRTAEGCKALVLRSPYYLNAAGKANHEAFVDLLILEDERGVSCCERRLRVPVRKTSRVTVLSTNETDRTFRRVRDDLSTGHRAVRAAKSLPERFRQKVLG